MFTSTNSIDTAQAASEVIAVTKKEMMKPEAPTEQFKKNCHNLVKRACALEAASITLSAALPPLMIEAGLSGLLGKPTAKSLTLLCLTTGGMSAAQAAVWFECHAKLVERLYPAVRLSIQAEGVSGFKATPTPKKPGAQTGKASTKPAKPTKPEAVVVKGASLPTGSPVVAVKGASLPTGSPLATDICFMLTTASQAALEAAWELVPASNRAAILAAFGV